MRFWYTEAFQGPGYIPTGVFAVVVAPNLTTAEDECAKVFEKEELGEGIHFTVKEITEAADAHILRADRDF